MQLTSLESGDLLRVNHQIFYVLNRAFLLPAPRGATVPKDFVKNEHSWRPAAKEAQPFWVLPIVYYDTKKKKYHYCPYWQPPEEGVTFAGRLGEHEFEEVF